MLHRHDAAGGLAATAMSAEPDPQASTAGLAALGGQLRDAGLTARAVAAWAGTARIAALPARLAAHREAPATPAAAILALLVGGAELARDRLAGRAALVAALIARGMVEPRDDRLRATVAIVPLGQALLVCDRLDAPAERELVCWPDDSSHHLATAIPPGRRDAWLDVGCGSAFAALARPELAARIAGVDVNPRAVRHARLGAALSGLAHVTAEAGDAGEAQPPADLVTCNAPIPEPALGSTVPALWRYAEPALFDRLWPALRRAVRPGGMIVVHAASDAMLPALADADGERVIVTYTPAGVRGFAVAWWRPDAPARLVSAHRALSPDRPHLDPRDREDALA
jgi:SAM-dependent methyltransferase